MPTAICTCPFRTKIKERAGLGALANVNVALEPLIAPVGVTPSANEPPDTNKRLVAGSAYNLIGVVPSALDTATNVGT